MIRLEIRSINSPDIDFYTWEPAASSDVVFLVELEIGEIGVEGGDLFQVVIATPEALRANSKSESIAIRERATLVVSHYDWPKIMKILESIVQKCESEQWTTSILSLQRYFSWEYENYKMSIDA